MMAEAFGTWLVAQAGRHDWVGMLADQARRDARFPRDGSPEDARKHLSLREADADAFEQLEDAEGEWLRVV